LGIHSQKRCLAKIQGGVEGSSAGPDYLENRVLSVRNIFKEPESRREGGGEKVVGDRLLVMPLI
jgi:hypothetical protein